MDSWEALKYLNEGKYIRRECWKQGDYVKLNFKGIIVNKHNEICPIRFTWLHNDWELYIIENK